MNVLEIEKLKHKALEKDAKLLESQLGVQTRINKMMVDEHDLLVNQNKELEDMLIAERRARKAHEGTSNVSVIHELKKRNMDLIKENQKMNEQVANLKKEILKLRSTVASYGVIVNSEHNYATPSTF